MGPQIDVQAVSGAAPDPPDTSPRRIRLLPGAIAGVETNYYVLGVGARHAPTRHPARARVFLFTCGAGGVRTADAVFPFTEVAGFAAPGNAPVVITATFAPLEYLEILIDLQEREVAHLLPQGPYFVLYSRCEAYTEAIKSARTISRTIVPPKTIPRFCMGSVEALGPDAVASHAHPMLEQLFFGLPGNACVVTADDAEAVLGDRALLHIPLGAWHGARVGEGSRLHYIWMDFFTQEEDLAYLQAHHTPIKG